MIAIILSVGLLAMNRPQSEQYDSMSRDVVLLTRRNEGAKEDIGLKCQQNSKNTLEQNLFQCEKKPIAITLKSLIPKRAQSGPVRLYCRAGLSP